jgi:hypothetical protein
MREMREMTRRRRWRWKGEKRDDKELIARTLSLLRSPPHVNTNITSQWLSSSPFSGRPTGLWPLVV